MNKHEEARLLFKHMIYSAKRGLTSHGVIGKSAIKVDEGCGVDIKGLEDMVTLNDYINESEATEKAYEELQRDVKRYFELRYEIHKISNVFPSSHKDFNEYMELGRKLSKVGNE